MGGWTWLLAAKDASGKERFSSLQRRSKTLRGVVKSTFGAETLSCTAALDDFFLPANSVKAMIKTQQVPVTLRTDGVSLCDHIHLTKQVSEKRLLVEFSLIRESLEAGEHRIWNGLIHQDNPQMN